MVNSGVSSLRSRVCTGGSANPRPPGFWSSVTPALPTRLVKSLENPVTLPRTAFASSYPVTSQAFIPNGRSSLLIGASALVAASSATGSRPSRLSGSSAESGRKDDIFSRSKPFFDCRAR